LPLFRIIQPPISECLKIRFSLDAVFPSIVINDFLDDSAATIGTPVIGYYYLEVLISLGEGALDTLPDVRLLVEKRNNN
jgi:hypothetical protein